MERFPENLVLRKLNGRAWALAAPFRYRSTTLARWIEVPAGFETDLASVPWFARWYVSVDGDHTKPALIHDFLYSESSAGAFPGVTRRDADRVFLEALAVRGVAPIRRHILHAAVRIGGGKSFRADRVKKQRGR